MIDLFEYASKHNVSIEISPITRYPQRVFNIKVKRDHYQMNNTICINDLKDQDECFEFLLDEVVERLNRCMRMR